MKFAMWILSKDFSKYVYTNIYFTTLLQFLSPILQNQSTQIHNHLSQKVKTNHFTKVI